MKCDKCGISYDEGLGLELVAGSLINQKYIGGKYRYTYSNFVPFSVHYCKSCIDARVREDRKKMIGGIPKFIGAAVVFSVLASLVGNQVRKDREVYIIFIVAAVMSALGAIIHSFKVSMNKRVVGRTDIKFLFSREIMNAVGKKGRNAWWLLEDFDVKYKGKMNVDSLEIDQES